MLKLFVVTDGIDAIVEIVRKLFCVCVRAFDFSRYKIDEF